MIKSALKQELIQYYEKIKSNVDIKSQRILLNEEITNERTMILEIYKSFIQSIDEICDKNMCDINGYNEIINDKDSIKKNILKSYCIYIQNILELDDECNTMYPIGILITFDWYPSENEIQFLK
jgi:hypothetical protein